MPIDIVTGVNIEEAREDYVSLDAKRGGYLDLASNAFDLARKDTLSGSGIALINKWASSGRNNQEEKIAPEVLNQVLATENGFDEATDIETALLVADRYAEKQDLMRRLQEGPSGIAGSAVQFGAGIAAHMTDPLELGLTIATGYVLGGVLATGKLGATAFKVGKLMKSNSFLGTVLADVTGELAIEPFIAGAKIGMEEDYEVTDFAMSTLAAPLGIASIRFGGKAMFKALKARAITGKMLTAEMGNVMSGKNGQLDIMGMRIDREIDIYNKAVTPSKPNRVFIATDTGKLSTLVDDLDLSKGGTQRATAKGEAHAAAGSEFREGGKGFVHEIDTTGMNIADTSLTVRELDGALGGDGYYELVAETLYPNKKNPTLNDMIDEALSESDTTAIRGLNNALREAPVPIDAVRAKDGSLEFYKTDKTEAAFKAGETGDRAAHLAEAKRNFEEYKSEAEKAQMADDNNLGRDEVAVKKLEETPTTEIDPEVKEVRPKDVNPVVIDEVDKVTAELTTREASSIETLRKMSDDGIIDGKDIDGFMDTVSDMKLEADEAEKVLEAVVACMGAP